MRGTQTSVWIYLDKKGISPDRACCDSGILFFMDAQLAIHISFSAALLLYSGAGLLVVCRQETGAGWLFTAGLACNGLSLALRYWIVYPLIPLYQGPFFLPFVTGLVEGVWRGRRLTRLRLFLVMALAWLTCLFPKDFYRPFLQFKTPFAHVFFLLGVAGQALFFLAGIQALDWLRGRGQRDTGENRAELRRIFRTVTWGFACWTLSVFSGAAWSWLGWGAPLVWEDPALASSMAVWLVFALILHLHLTRFSGASRRAWLVLCGAVFVFGFHYLPELGPFRSPWRLPW